MTLPEFVEYTRAYRSVDVWRVTAGVLERGAPRTRADAGAFYAAVCDELRREHGRRDAPMPRRLTHQCVGRRDLRRDG